MGGVLITIAIIVHPALGRLSNTYIWLAHFFHHRPLAPLALRRLYKGGAQANLGLTGKTKLLLQFLAAGLWE